MKIQANEKILLKVYLETVLPKLPDSRVEEVITWLPLGLYPGTLEFLLDLLTTYNSFEEGVVTRYAEDTGVSRQTVHQRLSRINTRITKKWGKVKK